MRQALMMDDDERLVARAFAAYFRNANREGWTVDQPSGSSGVVEHNGKLYVHLHNCNGTLAVYRVQTTGQLKRLRQWPKAIEGVSA